MAIKQLTLNQTINLIKQIGQSHEQINTVYFGDVWEFLAQTDNVYPSMFYSLTGSSINGRELTMSFSLFFLDRQLTDETNETEVLSDQLLIAQDVISMLFHPNWQWYLSDQINLEFFTENEKDYLAGVKADVSFIYPFLSNRCQIPSNIIYPN